MIEIRDEPYRIEARRENFRAWLASIEPYQPLPEREKPVRWFRWLTRDQWIGPNRTLMEDK